MKQLAKIIIGCLLFCSLAWAEEVQIPHRLTLITENYGQYNFSLFGREFEHRGDRIGGTSTQFVKTLLARAGIPYIMKLRKWRVAYERALTKPNYGVFSTARTDIREELFDWVGPIARTNWVVMVKKGSPLQINSLEDVRGLKVGGYNADALTQYAQSQGIEVTTLPNESLNPQLLQENMIDVWLTYDATAFLIAESSGYTDIEVAYVIRSVDLYLAMNKETDPQWLAGLHKAYDELVAEGVLNLQSY